MEYKMESNIEPIIQKLKSIINSNTEYLGFSSDETAYTGILTMFNYLLKLSNKQTISDYINDKDKFGRTMMHYVIINKYDFRIANIFGEYANLSIKDNNNLTPYEYICPNNIRTSEPSQVINNFDYCDYYDCYHNKDDN